MQAALKVMTRVLPGKRVEFTAPELIEGEDLELIVLKAETVVQEPSRFASAWEYLQSLPPIHRSSEEWAAIERELRQERDAWGG
jgi:hypothetical protein